MDKRSSGRIAVLLAFAFLDTLVGGIVLTVLWNWFVVWLGAPPINVLESSALMLIIYWAMQRQALNLSLSTPEESIDACFKAFGRDIIGAIVVLAFGFVMFLLISR